MKHLKIISILFLLIFTSNIFACTSVIISGKYTKSGRPILWKHRDTDSVHNRIIYIQGKKYAFQGIVNSQDLKNEQIWMGFNEAGFAIMNTASYNINPQNEYEDDEIVKDREGYLMRLALEKCATLEDFENLLNELDKPLGVAANFGVIDSNGGAAYYETGNHSFKKFDANDPSVAPFGYIVRSNYSYNGSEDDGYGYIRYKTADKLFYDAAATKDLSVKFILNNLTRSLKNSLLEVDLAEEKYDENQTKFKVLQDFIPRSSSASTAIIEGVKKGENVNLTTMYSVLGFQLCTIVTPTWMPESDKLPKILTANENNQSTLNEFSLNLKKRLFPIIRGSGPKYINLPKVINNQGTGLLQKTKKLEKEILTKVEFLIQKWRKSGLDKSELLDYYKWINEVIYEKYLKF